MKTTRELIVDIIAMPFEVAVSTLVVLIYHDKEIADLPQYKTWLTTLSDQEKSVLAYLEGCAAQEFAPQDIPDTIPMPH